MTLTELKNQVEAQLELEKGKGADKDIMLIAELETKQAKLLEDIMHEEQNQASQLRVQEATEQAAFFLDNLVVEGMTMRELTNGELEYQLLKIAVQSKLISLAEEYSKNITIMQQEENAQRNELKSEIAKLQAKSEEESREAYEDHETIRQLRADLHQVTLERDDFEGKLKNATDEIERLNSQVDDLRKEIAVGARNAYKVTDVDQAAQIKQIAEQIKAARIHVYDVVPDNFINPKNYTAKRVDNGDEVSYNWTQQKNYVVVTDPEEVERFRTQFANQSAVQDSPLVEQVADIVVPEVVFPVIPQADLPTVPTPMAEGNASEDGQGAKTLEEAFRRIEALEKQVFAPATSAKEVA